MNRAADPARSFATVLRISFFHPPDGIAVHPGGADLPGEYLTRTDGYSPET